MTSTYMVFLKAGRKSHRRVHQDVVLEYAGKSALTSPPCFFPSGSSALVSLAKPNLLAQLRLSCLRLTSMNITVHPSPGLLSTISKNVSQTSGLMRDRVGFVNLSSLPVAWRLTIILK